jgi:drug/metabolite transporter (DMT)-like permease
MLRLAIPALFVLIWSTGFIAAKFAAPHSDLQLFLLIRLAATTVIMAALAVCAGVRTWPSPRQFGYQLLAGVLLQGMYLCFSYFAIAHGMPAGIMALLGSLQPLFTALFVVATGTRLPARVWAGLLIGFSGVACVLVPKIAHPDAMDVDSIPLVAVATAIVSVLAVTAGSLLQKWLAPLDLRAAASIQNLGGVLVALAMTLSFGTGVWDGALELWAALAWSVIVASVIGTTLLVWMLRRGEATRVTALLLLVPPLAAVQAFVFFGEQLSLVQFVGLVLALVGVLLARAQSRAATTR